MDISNKEVHVLSSEEIGNLICLLGDAYKPYKSLIINNGINGEFICDIKSLTEFETYLNAMDVTNPVHKKKLMLQFKALTYASSLNKDIIGQQSKSKCISDDEDSLDHLIFQSPGMNDTVDEDLKTLGRNVFYKTMISKKEQDEELQKNQQRIQFNMQVIEHTSKCHGCKSKTCQKMKEDLAHSSKCTLPIRDCLLCIRISKLAMRHAGMCSNKNCKVPHCIREKRTNEQEESEDDARRLKKMRYHQHALYDVNKPSEEK